MLPPFFVFTQVYFYYPFSFLFCYYLYVHRKHGQLGWSIVSFQKMNDMYSTPLPWYGGLILLD